MLPVVREKIIDGFNPKARDVFQREFDFFDKVTSISGVLYPLPKEERRAGIRKYEIFLGVCGSNTHLFIFYLLFLYLIDNDKILFLYVDRELEKIEVDGDDLYLPTAPGKFVRGIQVDSGIPLQSAAKVPIMITFNVVDRDGDPNDIKPQACIFKVGI